MNSEWALRHAVIERAVGE